MEALVTISIFAILGLGFAKCLSLGYVLRNRTVHRSVAIQIASDEMERQARLRANTLSAGTTTTTVTKNDMQFQVVVALSAAAGGGFDVTVTVSDLSARVGGSVQLRNVLIPYGST